jgi:hypothetical protein
MMKKSKPRAPGFIAMQELGKMQEEMLDKLKDFGPKEQKVMEDQEKKRRLEVKKEAFDALETMYSTLNPRLPIRCSEEHDIIRDALDWL